MQTIPEKSLYDQDFCLWIADTVTKLKTRDFEALDLENLIEEIDSLGRSDRRELNSRLDVLLAHLLKRCYVSMAENYRDWELTIREQRKAMRLILNDSPSLRSYLTNIFDETWQSALAEVRQDYSTIQFPNYWPFSQAVDALLTEPFWSLSSE